MSRPPAEEYRMNMEVEEWKGQSMVHMFIATEGRKYGVPNIGVASAMFDIWSPLSNFHGVNRDPVGVHICDVSLHYRGHTTLWDDGLHRSRMY